MSKIVERCDVVTLPKASITAEGYLTAPARVAKVGILTYYDSQGKPFKEFVPAETLFDETSTSGLLAIPVTDRHPSRAVDASSASKHMRGFTIGPTVREKDGEDELLGCNAKVVDQQLVDAINSGMQELSCGYTAHLDYTPGTYKGEHYDAVQVKRIYNHVAVVPAGRAGHKARLRLDSEHNIIDEEKTMELITIKLDGKDISVPKEHADSIKAAFDKSEGATATEKARADKAEGALAVFKQADDASKTEAAKAAEQARIDGLVTERSELLAQAKPFLKDEDLSKVSNLDIMKKVLTVVDSEIKIEATTTAEYVKAAFDTAMRLSKKTDAKPKGGKLGEQMVHGAEGKTDATVLTTDQAEAKRKDDISKAWQKPLGSK